MHSNKK